MGHAQLTSGGFVWCIFLSYNGVGALYGNNLVSLYQLSSVYIV